MISRISLLLLTWLFLQQAPPIKKIEFAGRAQGTTYHITYYASDTLVTQAQIDSLLNSIDSALSAYKPYSLISQFNASASGITANQHLKNVVQASVAAWRDSRGIFDITIAPITSAWGFGPRPISQAPSPRQIRKLKKCVGSQYLLWHNDFLGKTKPCVTLDVNGIAQGYTVDVLAGLLNQAGIQSFVAELGGELRVKGPKPETREKMKIGIEVPGKDEFDTHIDQKIVYLQAGALTTSGSYRKYYESNGKRINHLIDARSGKPENNSLISVTVYAADGITADAYDNILMVLGLKRALEFVEARPYLAAHFIYRNNRGMLTDTASSRFYPLFQP